MVLNYGHTLAHALEAAAFGPTIRTGTSATARRWPSAWSSPPCWPGASGASTTSGSTQHRRVVGGFDLAADLPPGAPSAELVAFMGRDKKAQQDLTFVLDGPGGVEAGPWRGPGRRGRYPGGHGSADRERREPGREHRRPACRGPTSTCWASVSRTSTARPPWPTTWPRPQAAATRHGPDARAPPVQPRGRPGRGRPRAPGAGPRPSSSTPAPSPTRRGRCTTPWPPSTASSSSCTSPTRPPASRSATRR